jgi:hypothetical protein
MSAFPALSSNSEILLAEGELDIQLTLCASSSASSVPPHGDGLFVLHHILKVSNSAL